MLADGDASTGTRVVLTLGGAICWALSHITYNELFYHLILPFWAKHAEPWFLSFFFFCSESQSCLPELAGREEGRKMMSQEESDHFTWRSFHRHTKMAGSIFSSFPSSSCRMSYFCRVFLNGCWRRVVKGVGNANGTAATAGDGRHMAEVSFEPQPLLMVQQHHMMYVLAIRRLVWLARTQPFLVIPDSHCTGFLS